MHEWLIWYYRYHLSVYLYLPPLSPPALDHIIQQLQEVAGGEGEFDLWSIAQFQPHFFAKGGDYYKQVVRAYGGNVPDNTHFQFREFPGKTFAFSKKAKRLEVCVDICMCVYVCALSCAYMCATMYNVYTCTSILFSSNSRSFLACIYTPFACSPQKKRRTRTHTHTHCEGVSGEETRASWSSLTGGGGSGQRGIHWHPSRPERGGGGIICEIVTLLSPSLPLTLLSHCPAHSLSVCLLLIFLSFPVFSPWNIFSSCPTLTHTLFIQVSSPLAFIFFTIASL